jgi:uncharacterized YccA/Bax inhibitor family protein
VEENAMRTANPALNAKTFAFPAATADRMTLNGTVNRTVILLLILLVTTLFTWNTRAPGANAGFMIIGALGGFAVAMVTVFKKTWAPITAPIYAGLEGVFIGGLSSMFEAAYPGIVMQAVFLTFGTLGGLLLAYSTGKIKPTENFKLGVVAATGGIALVYLVSFILGFFRVSVPLIHGSGIIGIGFSVFVVIVAALNLVLDFDFIENGARIGAPKYMEWYAAFGLMVTLVWLYVEILRLLAKIRGRR